MRSYDSWIFYNDCLFLAFVGTELQVLTALKGVKSKPSAILLYVDSAAEAGAVELEGHGVSLCEQVKAVAEDLAVPVYAYIHGSATGSAYELASCADKIFARRNAVVGGIGHGAAQVPHILSHS